MITEIISYDGNTFAPDYEVGFTTGSEPRLPPVQARTLERIGAWPVIAALQRRPHRLALLVRIAGSSRNALRSQLFQWLDPEDEEPKTLVGQSHGGIQMSVEALCEDLRVYGDQQHDTVFVATLAVSDDVRWRAVTESTDTWNITATGQTRAVTNDGEDRAYPTLKVKPTSNKTGGYSYKRWIPVRWRVDVAASNYPVDIGDDSFDTQTLIGGGKMQADGDDLRVLVDGIEVDRWLDGINTSTTKVWVNLSFQSRQEATLTANIGAGDTVETLDVNEDTSGFASSGSLVINSEAFVYTGKNDALRRFTGVTRAAKGTSAGAHTAGDDVIWIQHDVWILYGNATASAPSVDDDYEPAFELDHSTNTSWVYEEFGEDDGLRPGPWTFALVSGSAALQIKGNHGNLWVDPWIEAGVVALQASAGRMSAYNPCGITNANFTNGETYMDDLGVTHTQKLQSRVGASWIDEYTIPDPGSPATWEAWSRNEALGAGAQYVAIYVSGGTVAYSVMVEAADCTLTLDNTATPAITIGAEQGNYSLECTITNNTTGEAIELDFVMELNEELEVDTDEKTVVYLADDASQMQALTLVGGARRDWLALEPGSNTLQFDDTGTGNVTIALSWEERFY